MKVFVYGTLKSGFGNHVLLAGRAECVESKDTIPGRMISLGGFPGWLGPEVGGVTHGETYFVPDEHREGVLRDLDRLEGYVWYDPEGSFYVRRTVDTEKGHSAFVYRYNGRMYGEHETLIENW